MSIDRKALAENRRLDRLCGVFKPMAPLVTPGQKGVAKLDVFHVEMGGFFESIETYGEDFVPPGTYARLKVNGQIMMSDTPMEQRTNLEIVDRARGKVLIAGLGIGMVLRAVLAKPEVEWVLVVEKYRDVMDLVLPMLNKDTLGDGHAKLEVLNADIFEWLPPHGQRVWDVIYFDIWPAANVKNLPEMEILRKRFRPHLAKGGWMDSWTYKKLKAKRAADQRFLRSELPRMLYQRLRKDGVEAVIKSADAMLLADQIDDESKKAVRQWLVDRGILVPMSE